MNHEKSSRCGSIGRCILRLLGVYCLALGVFLAPSSLHVPDFEPRYMGSECLASAVYYEARGEPLKGQRAVADVVIHRAYKSGKNFCEVVHEKQQFQWTKRKPIRYDADTMKLLDTVLQEPRVLKNENFLYFHATYVKPSWARKMQCKQIGNHIFCKERA